MKIIDPGHKYKLMRLDGPGDETLIFVKRKGKLYPRNKSAHPGTNIQEVLRACSNRLLYLYKQLPDPDTHLARLNIDGAIFLLEQRAARRHSRSTSFSIEKAVHGAICKKCGHIECKGTCHG